MDRVDFLLEIGSEEIPAGYLEAARARLRDKVTAFLTGHGIEFDAEGVETFATPRRIAVRVPKVARRTALRRQLRLGPSVQSAFDGEGRPTRAAEGFARSLGVTVDELKRLPGEKGERLGLEVETGGEETAELLLSEGVLTDWVDLSFPKTMRWIPGEDLSYARPIRWLVCLLGEDVVPMQLVHLRAGRVSRGHRTLSGGEVEIPSAVAYEESLEAAGVIVHPERRRRIIEEQARELAASAGGVLHEDPGLLDELVYLAEHPRGILGGYAEEIIDILPREVIVTAMRAHQRYFSVDDGKGRLLPRFITFRDGGDEGADNVRVGNERVLRARLDDALFYWNEDRSADSEEKLRRLDSVVWLEGFGSVGDKSRRVAELAADLAELLAPGLDREKVRRAGLLCKSDLATEMIKDGKEFTELQGIMGAYYALEAGEDPEVAEAIAEHLRPRSARDSLPQGDLGALVGLADRLDTICGCVLAGFAPTGGQDPYALRRQALAVVRILVERGWNLPLEAWIERALEGHPQPGEESGGAADVVADLFWGRLESFLSDLPVEIVRAVLSVFPLDPLENTRAARDLAALRGGETFSMLVEGARRCRNILVKAERLPEESLPPHERARRLQEEARRRWDEQDLLRHRPEEQAQKEEKELVEATHALLPRLRTALEEGAYAQAYEALSELGVPIDRYFTEVLVNAPDEALRRRRLDWLESLHYLFARFADLSRLAPA